MFNIKACMVPTLVYLTCLVCFQGFKYLYLSPEDFKKVSAVNSVHAELVEDEGESRYKIVDIIGNISLNISKKSTS